MHTDEYEISLFREVGVCESAIRKFRRILDRMESNHSMTTEEFLDRFRRGTLAGASDFTEWRESAEALRYWTDTRGEYQRLLDCMKISVA